MRKKWMLYALLIVAFMLIPLVPQPISQQTQPVSTQTNSGIFPKLPVHVDFWDLLPTIHNWFSSVGKNAWHWYSEFGYSQLITPVYASGIVCVQGHSGCTNSSTSRGVDLTLNVNLTDSFTVTIAHAPTDGNMLLLSYSSGSPQNYVTVSSITETGATWAKQISKTVTAASTFDDSEVWVAPNVSGASTTVTVNVSAVSAAGGIAIANIVEYSGLASVAYLDKTSTNSNLTDTADCGTTATTSFATELWFCSIVAANFSSVSSAQSTPTNGFTLTDGADNGAAFLRVSNALLDKVVSSTGAANSGTTLIANRAWAGAIATFKAAFEVTLSDSLSWVDVLATNRPVLSDMLNPADFISRSFSGGRGSSDILSVADSLNYLRNVPRSISDILTQSDLLSRNFVGSRVILGILTFTDALTRLHNTPVSNSESLSLTDLILKGSRTKLADVLGLIDLLTKAQPRQLTDVGGFTDSLISKMAQGRILADMLSLTDSISRFSPLGRVLSDTLSITDMFGYSHHSTNTDYHPPALVDSQQLVDQLNRLYLGHVSLSDVSVFADSIIRLRNVPLVLNEVLSLIDSLSRFGPPAVPTGVSAAQNSVNPQGAIDVSWTTSPSDNPADTYVLVERSTDQITWFTVCACVTGSVTDSGLQPGFAYYYRTSAFNGQFSAHSPLVSALTHPSSTGPGGGGNPPVTASYLLVVLLEDLAGTPLSGASVSQGTASLLTSTGGIANFGSLTAGTYTITVSANGCTSTSQQISLQSDHGTSNPLTISMACGAQQTTTTTGTAVISSQFETYTEIIIGLALAGMAIALFANERNKKKKRRNQ